MAEWEQIVTDGFPVPVTGSGAQRGAFGSLLVESLRPRTGWTFSYNTLNTRLVTATTTGTGAAVSVTDGVVRVSCQTSPRCCDLASATTKARQGQFVSVPFAGFGTCLVSRRRAYSRGRERDQHYCKRFSSDSRGMVKWPTGQ